MTKNFQVFQQNLLHIEITKSKMIINTKLNFRFLLKRVGHHLFYLTMSKFIINLIEDVKIKATTRDSVPQSGVSWGKTVLSGTAFLYLEHEGKEDALTP